MKSRIFAAGALLAAISLGAHAMPSAAGGAAGDTVKGEVLEVQKVASYTYLRLKTKDGEMWAAVPPASVKKGDSVTLTDAMLMQDFESKALKRKFDRILFASVAGGNANAAPHAMPAASAAQAPAPAHGAPAKAAAPVAKVAKAKAADARTVAEVVGGKDALKGKTVTIRGQVVKVTNGVLGKNWVHLQDGSGSAAKGNHDIIVTTTDASAVGDIVNASGTVRTDVKVGSGYNYAVLVEDAKLRK